MIYIQRERLRYSAIIYSTAKLSKLIIISSIISYKYVRFYGKRRPIGTNQTYFAYHNSILKCVGEGDTSGKRIGGKEDSLSSRCSIRSDSRVSKLWIKVLCFIIRYYVTLYSSQHNGQPCLFADVGGGVGQ